MCGSYARKVYRTSLQTSSNDLRSFRKRGVPCTDIDTNTKRVAFEFVEYYNYLKALFSKRV